MFETSGTYGFLGLKQVIQYILFFLCIYFFCCFMPILSAILLQYFRLSSFYLKFLFHKSCKHYLSRGILCSFVLLRSPHYLTIQSVNPVPLIVIRSANWVYCTYLVKVASRLTIFLQILIGAFLQNRSGGFSVRPSQPLHTIHTVYSLLFYCTFYVRN